jgi:RNA polymerase sigma-70 factor (ECF subfamily)
LIPVASAVLESIPDRVSSDPGSLVEEQEYHQFLTSRAIELLQNDFEPVTWKAFWETTVESRPAEEVAAEIGVTENAVYLAKSRVLRRLRAELAGLLD